MIMESISMVGECLSPESTVTSLLSSSGHLRSRLQAPEHNTTFRYRDKSYESASAALDAYITDFERSRQSSEMMTRSLVLPHSASSTPSRSALSMLRNKDVLRESLTDREVDFLNLPVSSLHHRSNRDRLSMTTNELLSIPCDGSMPVTHTSAYIQGLLPQSEPPQLCPSFRASHRPRVSHAVPPLNHQNHQHHPTRSPRSSRGGPGAAMLKPDVDISSHSRYRTAHRAAEPSMSLHLPHWLTSNKSNMNCSGISSVPDLAYPAWVQRCDLSEPPTDTESELWDHHGVRLPGDVRSGAPSWVAELEDEDPDHTPPPPVDSQQTLRDLRLQFAEQISLLAAEKKSSDTMDTLFRDNRIESLIQKADRLLNSLSQIVGGADSVADPVTPTEEAVRLLNMEELLLPCASSHSGPVPLDSAAAEGVVTEALTDRGDQVGVSGLQGSEVFKQPGPVEALKQMLFRLQAVETELQRLQQASAASTLTGSTHTDRTVVEQKPESEAEVESCPGGPSLQRALHHLSRLKVLVEEPKEKRDEKEEDEGRYSSSSAEGLTSSQGKPS